MPLADSLKRWRDKYALTPPSSPKSEEHETLVAGPSQPQTQAHNPAGTNDGTKNPDVGLVHDSRGIDTPPKQEEPSGSGADVENTAGDSAEISSIITMVDPMVGDEHGAGSSDDTMGFDEASGGTRKSVFLSLISKIDEMADQISMATRKEAALQNQLREEKERKGSLEKELKDTILLHELKMEEWRSRYGDAMERLESENREREQKMECERHLEQLEALERAFREEGTRAREVSTASREQMDDLKSLVKSILETRSREPAEVMSNKMVTLSPGVCAFVVAIVLFMVWMMWWEWQGRMNSQWESRYGRVKAWT